MSGVGVVPNPAWLSGSGLELDDGVLCDATLAAQGVDDVDRWYHPCYGEHVRFGHWTVAAGHGACAARILLATPDDRVAHAPVPYVWSDQYDTKIHGAGAPWTTTIST